MYKKEILPDDEYYRTSQQIKRVFWYLAVLISNSEELVSQRLQFGPKCQFLYFKPILAAILMYFLCH